MCALFVADVAKWRRVTTTSEVGFPSGTLRASGKAPHIERPRKLVWGEKEWE